MVFIRHRRWIIGMVFLLSIMLFNLPTTPRNGAMLATSKVAFDWVGQASYAYVDDNTMFTSPVLVNKGAILELEPGDYYWRVSGFGIVNQFEINSLLGIEAKEDNNNNLQVKNIGNEKAEVKVRKGGLLTGSFILEEDETKKLDDASAIELMAKVAENAN